MKFNYGTVPKRLPEECWKSYTNRLLDWINNRKAELQEMAKPILQEGGSKPYVPLTVEGLLEELLG